MNEKYDSLILVVNKSQVTDACKIYDMLSLTGKHPLILKDYGVEIENSKHACRSIYFYQDISQINFSKIRDDVYNLFHSIAEKKVEAGMTLRQLTNYKGVSFWDLSAQYIFSDLMPILYYINLARSILDFERPKEIYAIDNKDNLSKIFYLLCSEKSICFKVANKTCCGRRSWIKRFSFGSLFLLKKIKKFFIACYYSILNITKSSYLQKTYKVIFFTPIERFFLQMAPVILKYRDHERLVINLIPQGSSRKLKESKIFYLDLTGYDLFSYFDPKINSILKRVRDCICTDNAFTAGISYKGLPIGQLLIDIFEKAIYEKFPEEIKRIDIVRKIILSYKPKVIVLSDNSFEIALISRRLSIPTVTIQIGHPGELIGYVPCVADAVTVEGNYWKEYLTGKGVDANRITVTGSPKLDFLHSYNLGQNRNSLLGGNSKAKKIVMFATIHSQQGMEIFDYERLGQTKRIFSVMKNIKEAHLIVKLHPFDTNPHIYRQIAREMHLSNYSIVGNLDASKLLQLCDLIITHYSRVSYEAVLMDKNVIILNQSSTFDNGDVWDFKRYGVAIAMDNLDELENHIRSALFDREVSSRLRINRSQYIFEHTYKMDGKAADRVKEVVDQFI